MSKWIYGFNGITTDGRSDMKNLLGGKGANLGEMASIGLLRPLKEPFGENWALNNN